MNFGETIEAVKNGDKRACRSGWNGKKMFIYVEKGKTIPFKVLRDPIRTWLGGDMIVLPHFNMRTAQGTIVVGWLASQTDMLATDWQLIDS